MEDLPFNLNDWLSPSQPKSLPQTETFNVEQDIERVTSIIEATHTDITADYNHWIQIGFGLANELGEMGRSLFHRISRFNAEYNIQNTDIKYDNCLKNQKHGTTIKTFFYLAKQANIDIAQVKNEPWVPRDRSVPGTQDKSAPTDRDREVAKIDETESDGLLEEEKNNFNTPLLPALVYENLPNILSDSCTLFNDGIEKDIFLLSALTVSSGSLPHIEGVYFNHNLSPHVFLFIVGPSASGKGTMSWSRYFGKAIHEEMYSKSCLLQTEYAKNLADWENLPKTQKLGLDKPIEPPRLMHFIPANSSSSALIQLLSENGFRGIIFESEADTLSNTARQEWGDSSDIYRKAFHHENTSMARRTNRELVEIKDPHLAICLSGTPKQVHNLMPEIENGLFSRFMYYSFQDQRDFLNPFISYQPINYENYFTQRSYEMFHLFEKLNKLTKNISFELTEQQGLDFTVYFQSLLIKNKLLLSRDLDANTKRLGVITFRIAMILTSLRLMEYAIGEPLPEKMICSDTDFKTAITIASTLESHAAAVYQQMPKVNIKGNRLTFYENLPQSFDRKDYLKIAQILGINARTCERYISYFTAKLLNHERNLYTKINFNG